MSDFKNWPESLPIICAAINEMFLYNSKFTRNQLYFNPNSFQNQLRLHNLVDPVLFYAEQAKCIQFLHDKRRRNLEKIGKLDKAQLQSGNLVFLTDYKRTGGDSHELESAARDVYYIQSIQPRSARIVHLFNGHSRSIGREHIKKLNILDISKLQSCLEANQLKKSTLQIVQGQQISGP